MQYFMKKVRSKYNTASVDAKDSKGSFSKNLTEVSPLQMTLVFCTNTKIIFIFSGYSILYCFKRLPLRVPSLAHVSRLNTKYTNCYGKWGWRYFKKAAFKRTVYFFGSTVGQLKDNFATDSKCHILLPVY